MLSQNYAKNEVVVRLSGELDHMQAERLRPKLDEITRNPKIKRIVFDLENVSFMDSSGIGMILGRYRAMKRRGGTVAVAGAGKRVDRIFEMAGMYKLVEKLGRGDMYADS